MWLDIPDHISMMSSDQKHSKISPYMLAHLQNDIAETRRLEIQHEHMRDTFCDGHRLHPSIPAEVAEDGTVADVGTGTGIWLLDLMSGRRDASYPRRDDEARYIGFDISTERFPRENLPGVEFVQHDATKPFPQQYHGYFDIVHLRLLVYAITAEDLPRVVANVTQLLKPGGYLDWYEADNRDQWTQRVPGGCVQQVLTILDSERADRGLVPYMPDAMVRAVLDSNTGSMNGPGLKLLSFEKRRPSMRTEEEKTSMQWLMATSVVALLQSRISRLTELKLHQDKSGAGDKGREFEEEVHRCESLASQMNALIDKGATELDARTTWLVACKLDDLRSEQYRLQKIE